MEYITHILIVVLTVNSLWRFGNALSPVKNGDNVVFCSDPGTPLDGRRDDQLTSFAPGMKVYFWCDFTYKLVGPQSRTCLVNGSWSGIQPACEKYMCDELDALPPPNGKRIGQSFTIGSELKFKCPSSYKLIGQKILTCLPDGQWSSLPPNCEHRCTKVQCGLGKICNMRNRVPRCECRSNMDCTSKWDPVCGSDGVSYNNECIMKATACRKKRDVKTIVHDKCLPGDRCSIVPISKCRAAFDVHFYNVTSGKCQRMIAGGCHPSGWNGFFTKDNCQNYCKQDVCALKPEPGPCDSKVKRWYFDAKKQTCRIFKYGGCFGNPNNFRSLNDCEKRCY